MVALEKINGMEILRVENGDMVIRFLSPTGWRKAFLPPSCSLDTVSLPYRDSVKPIWYVEVNRKKVALC